MAAGPSAVDLRRAFAGRRVLVTGHSGFKGGWLSLWLRSLGADVTGVSLPPPPGPSLHEAIRLSEIVDERFADIGDPAALNACIADVDADLIIHMAAQPLVSASYADPIETYRTNVLGTAAVLDAARRMPSLRGVVVVTSDKCYENSQGPWGYRESDPMGGADPYSSSKGCTELVAASYRHSFFSDPQSPAIATVRAGNVFGGGDWAADRLVPDIIRGVIAGTPVLIRHPASVRPWQHVLEPLGGYLMIGAGLLERTPGLDSGWNFGPDPAGCIEVGSLAAKLLEGWKQKAPALMIAGNSTSFYEAGVLRLDTFKARTQLGWRPLLDVDESIRMTVEWYRSAIEGSADLRALSEDQITHYTELAEAAGMLADLPEPLPREIASA
jgi:CDP-glucose 4,6-dehydratase